MGLYMRAVLREWHDAPFDELAEYVAGHSPYRATGEWADFELVDDQDEAVLPADLTTGADVREELDELIELLDDLEGCREARDAVRAHLEAAGAVVGMQILASVSERATDAANVVIDYLAQRPGVMTQVDNHGWYDRGERVLSEPE